LRRIRTRLEGELDATLNEIKSRARFVK